MKYEEAKEIIENMCTTWSRDVDEALIIAIDALEKQIPKKVNWIYGRGMGIAHCPTCDRELHFYMNGCTYCLQAIDWSEEE